MSINNQKEAMFYDKLGNDKVKCNLCPNDCIISNNKIGFCGVRKNINGTLYTLIYGKISSAAIDPIEKKPLYNFYPNSDVFSVGTIGCNMRCSHCQNWQIAHTDTDSSSKYMYELSPKKLISSALEKKCRGLAFTYNEPTIWFEYTLDCVKLAKNNGLYTVYVTSGWIHQEPLNMIAPFIDAYSLDIKGFSDKFYKEIAKKDTFKPVLETAINVKKRGIHLEIITNIIPGYNDDYDQINNLVTWIAKELGKDTPMHFTAFHPAYKLTNLSRTPVSTLESAWKIGLDAGLEYVYMGNVYSDIGSTTFCPNCKTELIKRSGFGLTQNIIIDGKCPKCKHKLKSYIND